MRRLTKIFSIFYLLIFSTGLAKISCDDLQASITSNGVGSSMNLGFDIIEVFVKDNDNYIEPCIAYTFDDYTDPSYKGTNRFNFARGFSVSLNVASDLLYSEKSEVIVSTGETPSFNELVDAGVRAMGDYTLQQGSSEYLVQGVGSAFESEESDVPPVEQWSNDKYLVNLSGIEHRSSKTTGQYIEHVTIIVIDKEKSTPDDEFTMVLWAWFVFDTEVEEEDSASLEVFE